MTVINVVPVIILSHLHNLAALKAACVALLEANLCSLADVNFAAAFTNLGLQNPDLLSELRVAVRGLRNAEEADGNEVVGQVD